MAEDFRHSGSQQLSTPKRQQSREGKPMDDEEDEAKRVLQQKIKEETAKRDLHDQLEEKNRADRLMRKERQLRQQIEEVSSRFQSLKEVYKSGPKTLYHSFASVGKVLCVSTLYNFYLLVGADGLLGVWSSMYEEELLFATGPNGSADKDKRPLLHTMGSLAISRDVTPPIPVTHNDKSFRIFMMDVAHITRDPITAAIECTSFRLPKEELQRLDTRDNGTIRYWFVGQANGEGQLVAVSFLKEPNSENQIILDAKTIKNLHMFNAPISYCDFSKHSQTILVSSAGIIKGYTPAFEQLFQVDLTTQGAPKTVTKRRSTTMSDFYGASSATNQFVNQVKSLQFMSTGTVLVAGLQYGQLIKIELEINRTFRITAKASTNTIAEMHTNAAIQQSPDEQLSAEMALYSNYKPPGPPKGPRPKILNAHYNLRKPGSAPDGLKAIKKPTAVTAVCPMLVTPEPLVLCGCEDGTLYLFNLLRGDELIRYVDSTETQPSAVTSVCVTPDCRYAVAAYEDGRLRLFYLDETEPVGVSRLVGCSPIHSMQIDTKQGNVLHLISLGQREWTLWDLNDAIQKYEKRSQETMMHSSGASHVGDLTSPERDRSESRLAAAVAVAAEPTSTVES